jgi:hypothetical protein
LECANFSPFAAIVRRVSGLPVFDLYTLGIHAQLATDTDTDKPDEGIAASRQRHPPAPRPR